MPTTGSPLYIWISRWEDFQHYAPRRDRGPAWIKNYAAQLDDEAYWRLSNRQRALLHDLRLMFATMRARLPHDRGMIEARRQAETRHADIQSLKVAGFIAIVSRATLDKRLDHLYSSRVAAPSQEPEPEEEPEEEPEPVRTNNGQLDVQTELLLAKLLAWIGDHADERTPAVVRHALSQSTEAARVQLKESLPAAKPRHRARYVVGTLKAVTARE